MLRLPLEGAEHEGDRNLKIECTSFLPLGAAFFSGAFERKGYCEKSAKQTSVEMSERKGYSEKEPKGKF